MKSKRILKGDINALLKRAANEWKTYAPIKSSQGDVLFSLLPKNSKKLNEALKNVTLTDEWVVISPKDIFFPQLENLFTFDKDNVTQCVETSPKLIFGIKPCDTKGMLFVDEFFKRNYEDIYYLSRMKERVVVAIGCLTPPRPQSCFCTSANTGPFINEGYDLQFVDMGEEYVVEIGSEKGQEFTRLYSDFFKGVDDNEVGKALRIKLDAAKAVNIKVDFDKALQIMESGNDFEENYKRIAERCIYCGGCIYTCPTCTCFNVFDERKDTAGVRRRNWDACVFEGYTREASGHNPRAEKWIRTARRYGHKLKYDYSQTGMSGCVACGRCLASCPVEIGISKFIEEVTRDKKLM